MWSSTHDWWPSWTLGPSSTSSLWSWRFMSLSSWATVWDLLFCSNFTGMKTRISVPFQIKWLSITYLILTKFVHRYFTDSSLPCRWWQFYNSLFFSGHVVFAGWPLYASAVKALIRAIGGERIRLEKDKWGEAIRCGIRECVVGLYLLQPLYSCEMMMMIVSSNLPLSSPSAAPTLLTVYKHTCSPFICY